MYRTFVILRHTFLEAVVQPIYSLMLAIGAGILLIFSLLPFFTLGEDIYMFKAVGLDVILLLVLIATLFATSKSIFEEIEDRTMLTLMSKPVRKWEVLIGKYLGIALSAGLAVLVLGIVLLLFTWVRVPRDYQWNPNTLDDLELTRIHDTRIMHLAGLIPSLVLTWLQVSVLAAVSVAISTRVSLVVNLPVVIIIYLAGNLTRFLFPLSSGSGGPLSESSSITKGFAYVLGTIIPFLGNFDLRQKTVYSKIAISGTDFAKDINAIGLGEIWSNTATSGLYAACYVAFALSLGMLMFHSRELGGGEG